MYIMLYMFGYKVGAWFYCIEVCYNILYYFLHFGACSFYNIIDNSQTVNIL